MSLGALIGLSAGQSALNIGGGLISGALNFNRQLKFWRMQNEYNLPTNQRQRLEDAGLNPALMYSNGGVANTAGQLSQTAESGIPQNPFTFAQVLQQKQALESAKAQTELVREQAENARQERNIIQLEGQMKKLDLELFPIKKKILESKSLSADIKNKLDSLDLFIKEATKSDSIEMSHFSLNHARASLESLLMSNELRKALNPLEVRKMQLTLKSLDGQIALQTMQRESQFLENSYLRSKTDWDFGDNARKIRDRNYDLLGQDLIDRYHSRSLKDKLYWLERDKFNYNRDHHTQILMHDMLNGLSLFSNQGVRK